MEVKIQTINIKGKDYHFDIKARKIIIGMREWMKINWSNNPKIKESWRLMIL